MERELLFSTWNADNFTRAGTIQKQHLTISFGIITKLFTFHSYKYNFVPTLDINTILTNKSKK